MAAKSWGQTLPEWIELPRWARKYMYAEYIASAQIESVVAEESRAMAEGMQKNR